MSKESKIDILKNMDKIELDEALNTYKIHMRFYQRLIAMKLILNGHTHKETGEILGVSYQTINRWAKKCEEEGLNGLKPNFGGGRPSKLSDKQKEELDLTIQKTPNMTPKDVQALILNKFDVQYSMKQIYVITKQLDYNCSKPYPKYSKEPDNVENLLKKT